MTDFFTDIDINDINEKSYLKIARRAETFDGTDAETSAMNCRKALDIYLKDLFQRNRHDPKWTKVNWNKLKEKEIGTEPNKYNNLSDLISELPEYLSKRIKKDCYTVNDAGNQAVHYSGKVSDDKIPILIEKLHNILNIESFEVVEHEYIIEFEDDKILLNQIKSGITTNNLEIVKSNFEKLKIVQWNTPDFCDLPLECFKTGRTEIFNYFCEKGFNPENPIKSYKKKYNTFITLENPEIWNSLEFNKKYSVLRQILQYGQSRELQYILGNLNVESLLWDEQKIQSILHEYAEYGRVEKIYQICIEKLGDINIQNDEYRETALSYAVSNGNLDGVKILVQLGADPFIENCEGRNCFTDSIVYGKTDIFDYLVEYFKDDFDPNWKEKKTGNTYLMYCAFSDNVELFNKLWDMGCDPEAKNKIGFTILSFAALWNADKLIDALYALGKKLGEEKIDVMGINCPAIFSLFRFNKEEYSISCETLKKLFELEPELLNSKYIENEISFSLFSSISSFSNRIDLLELLYNNYKFDIWEQLTPPMNLLQYCFERAQKDTIQFFMEVEPNCINDARVKGSLLWFASKSNNLEFLSWVLREVDNDVYEKLEDTTPIEIAIINRNWNIIGQLLGQLLFFTEENKLESAGKRILSRCVLMDAEPIIFQQFIDNGFNINRLEETNSYKINALGMAINQRDKDKVDMVLELGADINATCMTAFDDETNEDLIFTPLVLSVGMENLEIVTRLLEVEGIEVNKSCSGGYTSALMAVEAENKEILELLIEKGADLYIKNDEGNNALDIAIQKDNLDLIDLILNSDQRFVTKENIKKIKKIRKNKIKELRNKNIMVSKKLLKQR